MAVQIKERSYFLWMLLSILTGGICGIIYVYLTMDDLNKLYARDGRGEAVSILLVFLLMLLGFGTIVYVFMIYDKLNEYIASKGGQYNVPSGMSMLLITLCLSWLTLGIITIYYGWKWQNAMNIQIRGRTR